MKVHETPFLLSQELARHVPENIAHILDPSVGFGSLLTPLLPRLAAQRTKLTCIDLSRKSIAATQQKLRDAGISKASCIAADFLKWNVHLHSAFDCVIMNPPFAAAPTDLRKLSETSIASLSLKLKRGVPVEAAFLCRAIELLKDKGRLVAIVPASIVMSERLQWLRSLLMISGCIQLVHELPVNSFVGVEARLYMMIFDKGLSGVHTTLQSNTTKEFSKIRVKANSQKLLHRLDYSYHHALSRMRVLQKLHSYNWKTLSSLASVIRGNVQSPNWQDAVHTTHCNNGFWRRSDAHQSEQIISKFSNIQNGDLLMKRVGRNCHLSIGLSFGLERLSCSDCVFIIRPSQSSSNLSLLFSLYCIFQIDWMRPLLERGTAASYVCSSNLQNLTVPANLYQVFPNHFRRFCLGQRTYSHHRLSLAVSSIVKSLSEMKNPSKATSLLVPLFHQTY